MAEPRRSFDPIGNYNFSVEMDGLTVGRFAAVDGLSFENELIEYRVSDQPMLPRFRPGTAKYGGITLKRGFTDSSELNDWLEQVQAGNYTRRDLTITLYDNGGGTVAAWNLFRCLPTKWSLSSMDGKGNECLHESIELRSEEIELVGSRARYASSRTPPTEQLSWGSPSKDDFIVRERNKLDNTQVGAGIEQSMIDYGPSGPGRTANQTMIENEGGEGQSFDAYQRSNWRGGRAMGMGLDDMLNSDGHVFDAESHNANVSAGLGEGLDSRVQSDASDQAAESEGEE